MSTGKTTEVLVGAITPTALPATPLFLRRSVEIQNLGPNPIYIAFNEDEAVVDKARKLSTGDTYSITRQGVTLYAITTVEQVTGAATIVMELQ
jgi:hypothetical protein